MRLKVSFEVLPMEDGYVAVASGSEYNGVIRLNSTAKMLFEFIQNGMDEQAVVEAVSKEYDASEEEILEDYRSLVESLRGEGLLE